MNLVWGWHDWFFISCMIWEPPCIPYNIYDGGGTVPWGGHNGFFIIFMVRVPQCILYHWVATMPGGGHNGIFSWCGHSRGTVHSSLYFRVGGHSALFILGGLLYNYIYY